MVLSTQERRPIEEALAEAIGPEHARRLMDEIPTTELATKDFVHGETNRLEGTFAGLRGEFAELRGEFAELRGEFAELRGEFAELRGEVSGLRGEMRGTAGDLRSEMERGFRRQTMWFAGVTLAGYGSLATVMLTTT